jgi:hypothetical protein
VDGRAAGNQQSGPGLVAVEQGEAEQPGAKTARHGNEPTADLTAWKAPEPVRHTPAKDFAAPALPFRSVLATARTPAGATRRSRPCPNRHVTTMIGKIMDLLTQGLAPAVGLQLMDKKTTRRGNYESGSDYVLEYGELRFAFNEEDFGQRVEQAAVKLAFVHQGLSQEELDDLLDLAVSGEIAEPSSQLGEHINENWEELVGPANRSLVHWIRRLVFRGAWLDQRVKEGELDVVFDERTQTFGYVQPDRSADLIELSKEPSWRRIAYRR